MDIRLADERAFILQNQLSMDDAQGRAWVNKTKAFGRFASMTSMLSRPKDDDFELVYKEFRYEPFWHIKCHARYVYERARDFEVNVPKEVESVTLLGQQINTPEGRLSFAGIENCREEPSEELIIDGITGEPSTELAKYLDFANNQIPEDKLDDISAEGPIFVPPQARASGIVRNVLSNMIKGVQADRLIEEFVSVDKIDLYYRPVFAYQFQWKSKGKEGILEYDGVTKEMRTSGRMFQQYVGKMLDPDFLFDVGAETVGLFIPGGGLAVKLAKQGIDAARND